MENNRRNQNPPRLNTGRIYWFAAAILVGIVGGVAAGWLGVPAAYRNTSPHQMRADYQADYVLMTAEVFARGKNAASAADRLAFLGDEPVLRYVQRAIVTGQELDYSKRDLTLLADLAEALQAWILDPEGKNQP